MTAAAKVRRGRFVSLHSLAFDGARRPHRCTHALGPGVVPSRRTVSAASRRADRRVARRCHALVAELSARRAGDPPRRLPRSAPGARRRASREAVFGCVRGGPVVRARGRAHSERRSARAESVGRSAHAGPIRRVGTTGPLLPGLVRTSRRAARARARLRTSAPSVVAWLWLEAVAGWRHRPVGCTERRIRPAVSLAARRLRVRIASAVGRRGCRRALASNASRARSAFDHGDDSHSERRRSPRAATPSRRS